MSQSGTTNLSGTESVVITGPVTVVQPDGNLLHVTVDQPNTQSLKSIFTQASSVVSGITTLIGTYTVPVGKTAIFEKVYTSGTNIAKYTMFVNGVIQASSLTYFGGELNTEINFQSAISAGYALNTGDIVNVYVIHNRPNAGDFNSRIQIIEEM